MLLSVLDSYLSYVAVRLQQNNAQVAINGSLIAQPVGGIVTAHDWPEMPINEGAVYLVIQRIRPMNRSKSQRQYNFYCQWTWLIIGTNIQATQQAENRGDRYIADMQIMQNLQEANYPGFCQKIDYSFNAVTGAGSGTPSGSVYPVSATERILWDELDFMPRHGNSDTGILYNAAAVTIVGWEDVAVAATLGIADTEGAQIIA